MKLIEGLKIENLQKAKKRLKDVKGFYTHLTMYFLINITVSSIIIISGYSGSDFFGGSPFNIGTFAFWFLWGIAILIHAIQVFYLNSRFGDAWEQRQMKKFLDEQEGDKI